MHTNADVFAKRQYKILCVISLIGSAILFFNMLLLIFVHAPIENIAMAVISLIFCLIFAWTNYNDYRST